VGVNFGEVYEAKQRSRPQLKNPSLEASVYNARDSGEARSLKAGLGLSRWMSMVLWCKLGLKEAGALDQIPLLLEDCPRYPSRLQKQTSVSSSGDIVCASQGQYPVGYRDGAGGLWCEAGEGGDEVGNATFLSRARSLTEVVYPLRGPMEHLRFGYVRENIAIVGRGCSNAVAGGR